MRLPPVRARDGAGPRRGRALCVGGRVVRAARRGGLLGLLGGAGGVVGWRCGVVTIARKGRSGGRAPAGGPRAVQSATNGGVAPRQGWRNSGPVGLVRPG